MLHGGPGRRYRRCRCVLTFEDARAFGEALRAEYPRIRFYDESETPVEPEDVLEHGPEILERPLRRFENLGDAREMEIYLCIVEPPGWRPIREPFDGGEFYSIRNWPELAFVFIHEAPTKDRYPMWAMMRPEVSELGPEGWDRHVAECAAQGIEVSVWLPETPKSLEDYEGIGASDVQIAYPAQGESEEHRRFRNAVIRILRRMTTNRLTAIDLRTGEPFGPPDKGGMFWAGPHALEWARQKPNRFLAHNLKPADWYDDWLARQESKGG